MALTNPTLKDLEKQIPKGSAVVENFEIKHLNFFVCSYFDCKYYVKQVNVDFNDGNGYTEAKKYIRIQAFGLVKNIFSNGDYAHYERIEK